MNLHLLTLAGLLIASTQLIAQDKYNLDFEHLDSTHQPLGLKLGATQTDYHVSLDSANRQNGNYAMLIERVNNNSSQFGTFGLAVDAPVSGSKLKLTGYIKTQDVTGGFAGLYLRCDDNGGTTLAFDNMHAQNIHGTSDWKLYSTEIPFNAKFTDKLNVGALLVGGGKIWVDNLHLYVDGTPIELVPVKPLTAYRTIDQKTLETASDELTRNYTPAKLHQLADFARIWGFLKYFHPAVTGGQLNWDSALVSMVPRIIKATPQDAYKLEEMMIDSMGPVPACYDCPVDSTGIRSASEDGGLFTANHFPSSLTQKLAYIRDSYNAKNDSYYMALTLNGGAEIHHEYPYGTTPYPPAVVRLIALFRYWNVMEYFYPYRNLISQEWDNALPELIPVFIHAADKNEYTLACLKMIAHLHDSHAGLGSTKELDSLKGLYMTPVQAKFVENKLVVIRYFGADSTTIKTGDIIQQIDGVPVDSLLKKYLPLTTGSNIAAQLRDLPRPYGWLLRSNTQTTTLTIDHDGSTKQFTVQRLPYTATLRYFPFSDIPNEPAFKLLDRNIGYIVPDKLKDNDIDTIRKLFKDTRGIIIDMRCYPSTFMPFTYGAWFKSTASPFAWFTKNSPRKPGKFIQAGPVQNGSSVSDTSYYKGKIIIIVSSTSQSQAEYTTMALGSTPGALVVGSMTAGADGNVSQIFLPGGIATAFSGLGVFYPDWGQTQRVGVRIDVPVHQTIKAIREGRDEYLEAALKLLQ